MLCSGPEPFLEGCVGGPLDADELLTRSISPAPLGNCGGGRGPANLGGALPWRGANAGVAGLAAEC